MYNIIFSLVYCDSTDVKCIQLSNWVRCVLTPLWWFISYEVMNWMELIPIGTFCAFKETRAKILRTELSVQQIFLFPFSKLPQSVTQLFESLLILHKVSEKLSSISVILMNKYLRKQKQMLQSWQILLLRVSLWKHSFN